MTLKDWAKALQGKTVADVINRLGPPEQRFENGTLIYMRGVFDPVYRTDDGLHVGVQRPNDASARVVSLGQVPHGENEYNMRRIEDILADRQ